MLDRTALNRPPNRLGLFGIVPRLVARRLAARVPRSQLSGCGWLYVTLALYAAEQGTSSTQHGQSCTVSVPQLAADTNRTVRTVQRQLGQLSEAGVLSIEARTDRYRSALKNHYRFLYPSASVGVTCDAPYARPSAPQSDTPASHDRVSHPGHGDADGGAIEEERRKTSTDSAKDAARAMLAAKGLARPLATDPATSPTSGAVPVLPVVPVPALVGQSSPPDIPVARPVARLAVPVAAPATRGWSHSPGATAPRENQVDRPGSGSLPATSRPDASTAQAPAPVPQRRPVSGHLPVGVPVAALPVPVGRPVPLGSLLARFPVRGLSLPVAVPVVPVRPPE